MTDHLNQLASEHIALYGFLTLGTVEYTLMDIDGTIEVILHHCSAINCKYWMVGECGFKRIEIGEDGRCKFYQQEEKEV